MSDPGPVFAALAEEETYPAVIHCAAGKDRTGIVVALVLRSAGVPDEAIVADYALTDGCMTAADINDYVGSNLQDPLSRIPGVGDFTLFGSEYAMRIWLDPDKLIEIIAALEPTFGGINLEDIKAPECFYIERKLRERMKIPVYCFTSGCQLW